jgi:hypothetical protein
VTVVIFSGSRRSLVKAFSLISLGIVIGVVFGCSVKRGKPPDPVPPDAAVRSIVLCNVPDPQSPTGSRILHLRVRRVTGGPEGLVECEPSEYEDGALKVDREKEIVVTVGPRSYVGVIESSP